MKKRIYCLLNNEKKLAPLSGDRINEMNLLRSMSLFFDVFYNGVKINPNDMEFGQSDKIVIPKTGEYDLIYVRANREVFLQCPEPKIWFASPYNEECFEQANAVACMTKPWFERLKNYSEDDYLYFDESYPFDMKPPKRCVFFPQAIELPTNNQLLELAALKPRASFLRRILRGNREDKRFNVTHFGPIRASNYPHQIVNYITENPDITELVKFTAIGPGKKVNLPSSISTIDRIPQSKVPYYLYNSDAIWYNQHRSGNVAGSLKVLEAMAYGKLIISPKWDARAYEMGEHYPLFWSASITKPFHEQNEHFTKTFTSFLELSDLEREKISQELRSRAEAFSIANTGKIVADQINYFLENI